MLLGRTSELNYLNSHYDKEGSRILVVYGQKYIGKTALVKYFMEDKPHYYYHAKACSEREQLYQWGRQLVLDGYVSETFPNYYDIFAKIAHQAEGKLVIVVDEFQYLIKGGDTFMEALISFVHSQWNQNEVLVLLSSSSIGWIENSMITKIGSRAAYELSGFLKIREMSFENIVERFPDFRIEECVEAYAVLGGFPGLWNQFDDRLTIQQNICRNILEPNSFLFAEGERLLTEQLREPGVYNTIMASIAAGNYKLNDLYLHTGFSRAKISVYLKNLIELELVEKVFSFDTAGKENTQKGIYRISHPVVEFYYTYMYPHMSDLYTLSVGEFYNRYIMPDFRTYVSKYFKQICRQHLMKLNERNRLPFSIDSVGEWIGKTGELDLVAQDDKGHTLIGLCNWKKPMTYEDYEELLSLAKQAKIKADYIYMYTAFQFDEKLSLEAKIRTNLKLVQLTDL
jgi:AAA+ ATPase superfamily predicted ATPase